MQLTIIILLALVPVCAPQGVSSRTGSSSGPTDSSGRSVSQNEKVLSWANDLPEDTNRWARGLFGEDKNWCKGTKAIVQIANSKVVQNQRQVDRAIVTAIVENYEKGKGFDAAEKTAVAVLEVLAEAVGTVKVEARSTKQGCWAIGFGRATATAVATGSVKAIGNALSRAVGKEAKVEFDAATSESATNVSKVVDSVAALIGTGEGKTRSMYRQVKVQAKVNVMACALARAFAAVEGEEAKGAAVASTGCQDAGFVTPKGLSDAVACRCKNWGPQPRGCGKHGVNGANDNICYVANPMASSGCRCAQPSRRYPGQAWRYCGVSLGVMQVYLNTQDNKNGIQPTPYQHGFCGALDSRLDR